MKTEVRTVSTEYIVNKERGVVVCKAVYRLTLLDNHVLDYRPLGGFTWKTSLEKKYCIDKDDQFKVTGVAKLHPEDTWDEEKGRKIAQSRCNRKAFGIAYNYYGELIRQLSNCYDLLQKIQLNCLTQKRRDRSYLDVLCGSMVWS